MKLKEWGYDQLINELEEHKEELSKGLLASIKCIRMIAEKRSDNNADNAVDHN